MKKLALALCLLAVSFTAQAQFEKGTTIINEVETYSCTQCILIYRFRPVGSGIYHQGNTLGKECTDLCTNSKLCFIVFTIRKE